MEELAGKTAVVTGAASGIGLATARAFAREGMRVVLADVEAPALASVKAEFEGAGHEAMAVECDVSKWDEVRRLADAAVERFDSVHVIHNNAGVVVSGNVEKLSLDDWEWVVGVNLWGVIYGVRAFLPLLEEAGEGHVVNTASSAGLYAPPLIGPYSVAKFGVVALTETLQRELEAGKSKVRASVLCPGMTKSRILDAGRNRPGGGPATTDEGPDAALKAAAEKIGIDAEVVADLVLTGIREQRFWLLPHRDWIPVLRDRIEGLEKDGRLTTGFGG